MKFTKLCLICLCSTLITNVASAADLAREIETLREDVTVLQRQLYRENDKTSSANGDVQTKINEYDEVIRKLTGRLDELEHQLKENGEKLERYNRDMEVRLKILEGQPIPDNLAAPVPRFPTIYNAPVAQDAAESVVGDKIKGEDLNSLEKEETKENNAATKSKPAPVAIASKSIPTTAVAPKPAQATATKQNATPAVSSAESNNPQTMYNAAKSAYDSGAYDRAGKLFGEIVEQYPKHALASSAQYWLGEVYLKKGEYNKAKVAFKDGFDDYKNGNKGADSLYRLGTTFELLEDNHRACLVLASFDDEYPNADKELKSKVNVEKIKLNCKEVLHGYK